MIYLAGSGGLEIHLESETSPFDTITSEIIDVDAVFRDPIDPSTYSLYIGCGGCVASEDPLVIPPVQISGYEVAEVEPFTQTQYRSVFPKEGRKYNTSSLQFDVCPAMRKHTKTDKAVHCSHVRPEGREVSQTPTSTVLTATAVPADTDCVTVRREEVVARSRDVAVHLNRAIVALVGLGSTEIRLPMPAVCARL